MENYIISIPASKKSFFASLMKELEFVEIKNSYSEKDEHDYIEAIKKSEDDILNGRIIKHSDLKKEILTWK